MKETPYSYQDALLQPDPDQVLKIEDKDAEDLEQLESFKNLRSLSLSGNEQLKGFQFLKGLPSLEELYLEKMKLREIPAELTSLKKLTVLFLGYNLVEDFSLLSKMKGLVDLGLEGLSLKKIPPEVLGLKKLKVLGLAENSLRSVAPLKALSELEELYLSTNSLIKLPGELTSLKKLRKLDISCNYKLKELDVVKELTGLEELQLTNSHKIERLPDEIFGLTRLKVLKINIHWNASKDSLAGISSIQDLTDLEELHIHGSGIKKLPRGLSELKRLRVLNLKDNERLHDISELRELPCLEQLDLSKCNILEVPQGFSSLKALRTLELSHNKDLKSIEGLRDLPRLEECTLYSKLKEIPDSLGTCQALKVLKLSADAQGVAFLEGLTSLEELYIADISFTELPTSLKKLKRLTIFREECLPELNCLEHCPDLEELAINQPAFTLPALPGLKSLSIGQIQTELDLSQLSQMSLELRSLKLHRFNLKLMTLPREVAAARSLETLCLEFMKSITNISAVTELLQLRELELRYCEALSALPAGLSALQNLEQLKINDCALDDLSEIRDLPHLRVLELDSLDELRQLPASFSTLANLTRIKISDCDNLREIAVLKSLPRLSEFSCTDTDCPRKEINAIQNAVDSRGAPAAALETSYQDFIRSGQYKELVGKKHIKATYGFPLTFDTPENLLQDLESFSWLDDHRDDEDSELSKIFTEEDHYIVPLAVLDWGYKGCEDQIIDAYAEEFFLVDREDPRNPVYRWGHDYSDMEKLHSSFDDFLANLKDFTPEGEGVEDECAGELAEEHAVVLADSDAGEPAAAAQTYLEFKDDKSSKFWQIKVEGTAHTVTYGKIGSRGSSKTKTFDSAVEATKSADKLTSSKKKKGYI